MDLLQLNELKTCGVPQPVPKGPQIGTTPVYIYESNTTSVFAQKWTLERVWEKLDPNSYKKIPLLCIHIYMWQEKLGRTRTKKYLSEQIAIDVILYHSPPPRWKCSTRSEQQFFWIVHLVSGNFCYSSKEYGDREKPFMYNSTTKLSDVGRLCLASP